MKNQLIYLVKHNNAIKSLFVFCGSAFFRLLGLFLKIDQNMILFVPNTGKSFSGSPRDIFNYMQNHQAYKHYRAVWAFNNPDYFAERYHLETVKFDSFAYFKLALQAKYWVTDINIERGLHFKKKQTIFLNTWHGVALKKIGNDDPNSAKYNYHHLNYLCVSSDYDKKVFQSALKAPASSFLEVGMPRNDRLIKSNDDDRKAIRKELGLPIDKKIILYAPTWRDSKDKGKTFSLEIPVDFARWEQELSDEFIVLFRAHSRTTELLNLKFNHFIRDYSHYNDLNNLLIASDLLITDYSSIAIDYALLEKPLLCFAYDYEDYLSERGFYINLKDFYQDALVEREAELLGRIKSGNYVNTLSNVKKIKEKYMCFSKGDATQRCVEALLGSGEE